MSKNKTSYSEILRQAAIDAELTQAETVRAYEAIRDGIVAELAKGNSVLLPRFANFEVVEYGPRMGRDPQLGVAKEIPAKSRVKIRPKKMLAELTKEL